MLVHTATLKAIVEGQKQFQVPIWQRQYTWRNAQHEQLWSDLAEQYQKEGKLIEARDFVGAPATSVCELSCGLATALAPHGAGAHAHREPVAGCGPE